MTLDYFTSPQYRLKRSWQQFWNIFQLYEHQNRLEALRAWAKRKKLAGIYTHYNNLYLQVSMLLNQYQLRSPHLAFSANIFGGVYDQIKPQTHYQTGYAAIYKKGYRKYP